MFDCLEDDVKEDDMKTTIKVKILTDDCGGHTMDK
jgi:hypothetical protein